MRIMVTGGAGFIGSHFLLDLLDGSYPGLTPTEVVVLDKLTYAGDRRVLDGMRDARLSFVRADICDRPVVLRLMKGIDLVVHFAAETHVDRSIAGSDEFLQTNVAGTQNLLHCALEAGVGRFVHVSTDEVYGSIEEGSWDEACPLEPNSPYSASKASSDLLVRSYHRTYGLDACITRCSNNYGPRQFPEKVIPRFVTTLLEGGGVPLYGDGSNVREWLHVSDHCRGVALVAEKGRAGETYNIGGGAELSNRELTGRLLSIMGLDWDRVRRVPDRKGHDLRYSVDHSKIAAELGYEPRIGLDEGLEDVVRWYAGNPHWWKALTQPA
ncbi:dTDP-glucose 4,6-dehydratase [Streptomonospora litoralis]|uniref:dTDP-glucose 4,6-dehydratase n=1 Tax=Streptomonospora litoralis TaxID=2498135 RepID=A0A4P6Q2U3_9ACTN|nr:dTDP-glucose 4,6-dehydratase [Streptomonospora litoralis]QBI54885.1 dTDP-glucose 4,6-dehydratase [Streptomonospora litoralis]